MDERNKKITIRFTEREYQELLKRAKSNSMKLSAYIRESLLGYPMDRVSMGGDDKRDTVDYRKRLQYQISSDLTKLQYYIEKFPDVPREDVSEMKGLVNHIWQSLK